MSNITSIILHYKRPENVDKWIEGIKMQTVESDIMVWDNSGDFPENMKKFCDVYIQSSKNFYCQPRFLIGGFVNTLYTYNQDDDLAINDKTLFEKFIDHAEKFPNYVIGWNGRIFSKDINWDKAYQSPGKGWVDSMLGIGSIDMINVGVSFYRTALVNQIPINPFQGDTVKISEEEYKYADDIWISYWLTLKRTMPFQLLDHYDWLNEYEEREAALSKQPHHMDIRNQICRKLFHGKYSK